VEGGEVGYLVWFDGDLVEGKRQSWLVIFTVLYFGN
jgi:hypothetical protein